MNMFIRSLPLLFLAAALPLAADAKTPDGKPFVLFIAGKPSHGPGDHEHNAGVQLLAKCLGQGAANVATKFHLNAEWPGADELAQADTIVIYSDGQGGHPALMDDHLEQLKKEMARGCGLVCLHYAVEPIFEKTGWPEPQTGPDGKPLKQQPIPAGRGSKGKGAAELLDWLGGYFEQFWSVNPHWTADFATLPSHPITSGVKPFSTNDEWYFFMRFRPGMQGVTPILTAVPPLETMNRGEGDHGGNPDVRREVEARKPQHVAWAGERANGGRGFGFTGGHFHKGWGNDDQRRLVLNAILWTAKVDVPAKGVESKITEEDLAANLDPKPVRKAPAAPPAPPAPKPSASNAKPIFESALVHDKPVEIKVDLRGAKELYLAVTDGGDGFGSDWADWIEPVLLTVDGTKLKLTDMKPKSAKVGWGSFGVNRNPAGKEMKVGGQPVAFGFGAHAPSLLAFDLPAGVTAFEARGCVDDGGVGQHSGATVTFHLYTQNPGDKPLTPSKADGGGSDDRYGLEKAKRNMSTFTTPDGLQASLAAAEPMIQNPTNIDIDPRGRIWATECVNYRKYGDLRGEGDRVVILEDTDGDGVADKDITFFQSPELTNPLGILVLPGPGGAKKGTHVIVSAAPNVWLLTDSNGDDKADKKELLFQVKGNWNHDHQVHAFVFGPDGKFYFNCGNESREVQDANGNLFTDLAGNRTTADGKPYRQGLVFRCDIDLATAKVSNVETLGNNFRNNYEVTIDSFGTLWQSDNDDDGNKGVRINYVMEFGNYGYGDELTGAAWQAARTNIETEIPLRHWHQNDPGVIPNLLQTGGGSPTGITVNEGTALGPQFTNQLIHCDAGPRTVRAYPVENDGAGYKATMVDVLTSSDSWYRPSDVSIAPDGSLFVADWYDPGVGGHGMGDHDAGKIMGRVYRVTSTGATPKAPTPDFSTAEGAIKALQSPNRATVYTAWQSLNALGAKAESALQALAKNENPRLRARALGLLVRVPGRGLQYLRAGLTDPDAGVRVAAVRLGATLQRSKLLDTAPLEEDLLLGASLLNDPSPQVRRQIALSLHQHKDLAKIWAVLATKYDGKDRWYLEALGIGSIGHEAECLDAWLVMVGDKWNTPAGRDILWRVRSPRAAEYLAKIIAGDKVAPEEKPRFFREFDFLPPSPQKSDALVQLASLDNAADEVTREALSRLKGMDLAADPKLSAALKRTLDRAKGTPQFIDLVRNFRAAGQGAALLDTALAIGGDPAAVDAVRMVFAEKDADKIISEALAGPKSEAVVSLLGGTSTPQGFALLTSIASDAQRPAALRQQAVRALARTQSGAEVLIKLARNSQLAPELTATAGSALRLVEYASLKKDIDRLFPAPAALGGKPLPAIAELVKLKGDIEKGRAVFERAESSCITCHKVNDKGADFAPALSEIGTKLPKEALYDAIVNPNASVTMGFETTQLATKDGGAGMGIVRSETREELVLALPGGVTTKFRKSDITNREKLTTSMMPSGLNQALTQDDLVNLVEYLASLKKK